MTSSLKSNGSCIDNNHSHFILVDDGTVGQYGREIKFRASFENCLANKEIPKSKYQWVLFYVQIRQRGFKGCMHGTIVGRALISSFIKYLRFNNYSTKSGSSFVLTSEARSADLAELAIKSRTMWLSVVNGLNPAELVFCVVCSPG